MIMYRYFRLTIITAGILLISSITYAGNFDYIDFLNNRNNKPRFNLSTEWTWEGAHEKLNLPCIFPDSSQNATIYNEFIIPDTLKNSPLKIWFLGIQGFAEIIVNGNLIRTHTNFNSPFSANIPPEYLYNPGKNIIKISLSRQSGELNTLPQFAQLFRQKSLLAVTREIFLEWQPECRFNTFNYSYNVKELSYTFEVDFLQSVVSQSKRVRLQERVLGPDGKVIFSRYEYIAPEKQQLKREITKRDFLLWSPESPHLYFIELRLITASGKSYWNRYRIGLRSLTTSANSILLNGKSLNIRGITYRETYTDSDLNLNFKQKILNDLTSIRNNNLNALRIPHSVPHPLFAEICDSLGILLFIENWIWRLPEKYFADDYLLRTTKMIGDESLEHFYLHPSFAGYCLGDEISIEKPVVQKFILIVNEYLKHKFKFLSYVSPLDENKSPGTSPVDIYSINKYDRGVFSLLKGPKNVPAIPVFLANVGFASSDSTDAFDQADQWRYFMLLYTGQSFYNGFFIESFNDWPGKTIASPIYGATINDNYYYTYGLFNEDGTPKNIVSQLNGANTQVTVQPQMIRQTNFFSLSVFIASIIFFLIYRSNYRLRENMKRALTHPYGFFIDLRDRRIISISNSSLIALFTTMIVANVLAAYVYYYRDNLLFDEFLSTILNTPILKKQYYSISDTPFSTCLAFWVFSYSLQVVTALIMKTFNLFSKNKFRFRQSLAVSNWSGAPIVFLIPVSLLSLQIIAIESLKPLLIIVIVLFIFWYHFRLIKGIRILFMKRNIPVIMLVILTYGGLICTFIAFSGIDFNTFSYWLVLTRTTSLF